jgi:hypothetical protein
MKKNIFALLTIFAADATNAEVYQGTYAPLDANCGALSDHYFRIGDGWVGGHESYCEIIRHTNVERMQASLIDTNCSAEGEEIGVRFFIASTFTIYGPGLTVYSSPDGGDVGSGSIYKFCPGLQ